MTPWELQDEFYKAAKHFYDFGSAKTIGKIFGFANGARRFGLAIFARQGPWGAHLAADHFPKSSYYKLKHLEI